MDEREAITMARMPRWTTLMMRSSAIGEMLYDAWGRT
jgi:hypothetical protein